MYVDPKPLSVYGETQGWKMPSSQPSGTLKRPPILKSPSSSSSLSGMEQTIPSFQSFVKRTPPPEIQKPLPPTPLRPRRPSSFDSSPSRPTSRLTRRSSSVYSRGTSIWDLEPEAPAVPSWQTSDFADQNMMLRPIAYSASTSQLIGKQPDLHSELRTYSPLINTPSPTISRESTPSPLPPEPRPSVLLPPPAAFAHIPKKHLRMVSLEKAKEIVQAPGAVHLLPEEMRAQALGRARSQEPMRLSSIALMSGRTTPPALPKAPTLVDRQGRERILSSPRITLSPESFFPSITSPTSPVATSFHVGSGPARSMAPISSQPRKESRAKAAQALGLENPDEERGRARQRGPRNMSYEHYMPTQSRKKDRSTSPEDFATDAQMLARDYHDLLSEQYRQPSVSPASLSTKSDTDVIAHMKMVPQPLFHTKPASRMASTATARSNIGSVSPFSGRVDSGVAFIERRRSSGIKGFFPIRLSVSSRSSRGRRSTSGSIPISPPFVDRVEPTATAPSEPVASRQKGRSKNRRKSEDNRVSAYYPHIMPRKKKGKGKKDDQSSDVPAMPSGLLAADIIAARLMTPDATPTSSPLTSSSPFNDTDAASVHSEKSARRLPHRMLKSAMKYTDKVARPSESPARRARDDGSPTGRVASPESPHLLPSPSSGKPPPTIHLGWSNHAKSAFDQAPSSVTPAKGKPESLLTHVQTPARALDESKDGLAEPESPSRKGSIFGGLMEGWRESKAEKRRQELKRMITVVPTQEAGDPTAERPGLLARRFSAVNWM